MQENNNKVPLIKLKIFLSPCDLKTANLLKYQTEWRFI